MTEDRVFVGSLDHSSGVAASSLLLFEAKDAKSSVANVGAPGRAHLIQALKDSLVEGVPARRQAKQRDEDVGLNVKGVWEGVP